MSSDVRAKLIRNWKVAAVFLLAGLLLALSLLFRPEAFDVSAWRLETIETREAVVADIAAASAQLASQAEVSPESELSFATQIDTSAAKIHLLIVSAEASFVEPVSPEAPSPELTSDLKRLSELKLVYRSLRVLERLHRSRAALAEADRRTSPSLWESNAGTSEGPRQPDGLFQFWNGHRPWMSAELNSLREIDRTLGKEALPGYHLFLVSLENDLDQISRAAMDLEIRRVDTWIEWAVRQPGSRLSSVKQDATEQARRLNSLSSTEPALPVAEDPRFISLHRDLRRMASVATKSNWE